MRSTLPWCVWTAHWLVVFAVWLVAIAPRYRVDFLHVLFIGGFTLLIVAVGTPGQTTGTAPTTAWTENVTNGGIVFYGGSDRIDVSSTAAGHTNEVNLTGGSIHNIALSAAFLAASRGEEVTMPAVIEATRAELRKLDKPVDELALPRGEGKELRAV